MSTPTIHAGKILTGPLFSEPMLVETVRSDGPASWIAGLVGQQSERFLRVTLTADDIATLTIADSHLSYDGDGRRFRSYQTSLTVSINPSSVGSPAPSMPPDSFFAGRTAGVAAPGPADAMLLAVPR